MDHNSPFIQIFECRSAESKSNIRNEKWARLDVGKRALRPRKRAHIIPQGHHGQVGKGHLFLAVSNPIFLRALRPMSRAPTAMAVD